MKNMLKKVIGLHVEIKEKSGNTGDKQILNKNNDMNKNKGSENHVPWIPKFIPSFYLWNNLQLELLKCFRISNNFLKDMLSSFLLPEGIFPGTCNAFPTA